MRSFSNKISALFLFGFLFLAMATSPTKLLAQEEESAPDSVEVEVETTDLMRAQELFSTVTAMLDTLIALEPQINNAHDENLQLLRVEAGRHIAVIDDNDFGYFTSPIECEILSVSALQR